MFYVLNNGGDIEYPRDGFDTRDERDDYARRISGLNRQGFYLHYDGERNHLVSFFKGYIGISNQYYGIYYGEDTDRDIFTTFQERVEDAFDSQGWQISTSTESANAVYTNLSDARPVDLAISDDKIKRALASLGESDTIQLGTPDFRSALGVCKRLIQLSENVRVSICTQGIPDEMPSDVVVVPNAADEPGAPVRETKDRIEEQHLVRLIRGARASVESYIDAQASKSTLDGGERALVEALEANGVSGDLGLETSGIRVDTKRRKQRRTSRDKSVATLLGGVVGLGIVALVSVSLGVLNPLLDALGSTVNVPLEAVPGLGRASVSTAVPSAHLVGLCLGIVLLSTTAHPHGVAVVERLLALTKALPLISGISKTAEGRGAIDDQARELLSQVRDIAEHPGLDDVGGLKPVITSIFEVGAITVYDTPSYRWATLQTASLWLLLGALAGILLTGAFAVFGQFVTDNWTILVSALLVVTGVVGTVATLVTVKRVVSGGVDLVPSGSLPARERLYGLVLVAGGLSTTQLGGQVWRSEQGLSYHLVSGAAGATLGRVVSVDVAVEVVFFLIVGAVLGTLSYGVLTDDRDSAVPATLLVVTLISLGYLWTTADSLFISSLPGVGALLIGVGVVALLSTELTTPDVGRRTNLVVLLLVGALVVAVFEGTVDYRSPLVYNAVSNQFAVTAPSDLGYTGSLTAPSLGLTGLYLAITCGVFYAVFDFLWLDDDHVEVLVLGPPRSDPLTHIALLYEGVPTHWAGTRELDDRLVTALNQHGSFTEGVDTTSSSAETGVHPVRFTMSPEEASTFTIWTPLTEHGLLQNGLVTRLGATDEERPVAALPDDGYPEPDDESLSEVVEAFHAADVVVLLFPIADVDTDGNPDRVTVAGEASIQQPPRYLDAYRDLLDHDATQEKQIYGVVSDATRLVTGESPAIELSQEIRDDWEGFCDGVTKRALSAYPTETRSFVLSRLANPDGRLFALVASDNRPPLGATEELEHILDVDES